MSEEKVNKLNRLLQTVPDGFLVEASTLAYNGYKESLRNKYVERGWLTRPARGVYQKVSSGLGREEMTWQWVVFSLQTGLAALPNPKIENRRVLVSGLTALELQGMGHYVPLGGRNEVHLSSYSTLPGWVYKLPIKQNFICHKLGRLFDEKDLERHYPKLYGSHVRDWSGDPERSLTTNPPELAILELLELIPRDQDFDAVDAIFEGLTELRPKLTSDLLLICKSVKVKRLFFWFARRHNHAWLKHLDEGKVDLGSGKRAIVKGGKLDKRYSITVPEHLHDADT